ncbi:hypothetical protein [Sphingomonas bacterium]|uniref:hypothetical protein n=1 Tax=Sphingomonas bacterium TaxID=1895847 RepID=UPI001574F6E0|nr:hypothetical protein [Sphingomonas bacterium]
MNRSLALLPALSLIGCVSTVTTVATAPFRVAGKAVDVATTSPAERDRNYAHKMRKEHEREERDRKALAKRCRQHPEETDCGAARGD